MCGRATQPEPSTPKPQASAVIRTTLGRAARTPGERSTRESGGVVGGAGPAICGNGSTRARARNTVRGGATSFRRCRIVDCCTSVRSLDSPGIKSSAAPGDPDEREPEPGAYDEAADRIEEPQWRDDGQPAARERARRTRRPLQQRGADQCPDQAGKRRVRGIGSAVQEMRRDARADQRAGDQPAERERGRDQSAAEARERTKHHDRGRDPVDARHRGGWSAVDVVAERVCTKASRPVTPFPAAATLRRARGRSSVG